MLTLFEQAIVLHLIGDWIFQNDWMSVNKPNLKHPAAWIHSVIHMVLLGLVLGWEAGIILGAIHMIIDTRIPFRWWRNVFCMTDKGPMATHVAIWTDQVLHILSIAAWVQFVVPEL